jgi:hypothetical protein
LERERDRDGIATNRDRERKKEIEKGKGSGSQHTSTLLQVMFILEHLQQVWLILLQDTAYDIAMVVRTEGVGLVPGAGGVLATWAARLSGCWSNWYIWLWGDGCGREGVWRVSVNRLVEARSLVSYVGRNGVRFRWAGVRRSSSGFVPEIWLATTTERCKVVAWFTTFEGSNEESGFEASGFEMYIG